MENATAALAAVVSGLRQRSAGPMTQQDIVGSALPASGNCKQDPGPGRFYVISAAEDQPAASVGHFVRIESGPHEGYEAAVASLGPNAEPAHDAPSKGSYEANKATGGQSTAEQLAKLLRASSAAGGSGLPAHLEGSELQQLLGQGGTSLDANALHRLLEGGHARSEPAAKPPPPSPPQRSAPPNPNAGTIAERGELVFLPLDTPVWHLPNSTSRGDESPYLVTRAENVEWMRMIWGKMTDASSVMEALGKQAQQAGEEKQRQQQQQQQQQEQQQQQQQVLNQLSQLLGAQKEAQAHAEPAAFGSGGNNNNNDLGALLSQVLGSLAPQQSQSAPPPQQSADAVLQSLQRELEAAVAKTQATQSIPRHPSHSSLATGHHRRNTSVEMSSLFDSSSAFPGFNPPAPRHHRTSSTGGTFHAPPPQPVRANLMPGSVQPGQGQFYVISADARIQLTESGFYLAVVSGPHDGFDAALEALALWTHRRPSMREDTEMVHICSDTPIWHSTELLHGQPLMIVKSSSLLEAPRPLREQQQPPTHSRSQSLGGQDSQGAAQLATNQLLHSLAALSQQAAVEPKAEPNGGGLSRAQLQQLAMLQGMVNLGKQEPSLGPHQQAERGHQRAATHDAPSSSTLQTAGDKKEAHQRSASQDGVGVLGAKRAAPSSPEPSTLPNKKAHILRWQAAHPSGEGSQPGSSALNGDADDDDGGGSDTESAELDDTNACAPTTAQGGLDRDGGSPKSAAEGTALSQKPPRPSPLKVPGDDTAQPE